MKTLARYLAVGTLIGLASPAARAQFTSGSTGALGALHLTSDTTWVQLPDDGRLNYTTITIDRNAALRFYRNARNTPVYLLASGDITIIGVIDVSGTNATNNVPGEGGPGGFDGGRGIGGTETVGGSGLGPGGGKHGIYHGNPNADNRNGSGSYSTKAGIFIAGGHANDGATYGNSLILPFVGGSGGGGKDDGNEAGGGGGGAILIVSSTRIDFGGDPWNGGIAVVSYGGTGANAVNRGSGGAIRIVTPILTGRPALRANSTPGAAGGNWDGGDGRMRIDALNRTAFISDYCFPTFTLTMGKYMVVTPENPPKLEVIEVAGQTVDPASNQPLTITLPAGTNPQQTVKVRATNFGGTAGLRVVLTPETGDRTETDLDIVNPGPGAATGTATVTFPVNVLTRVDVWTR